MDRIPIAKPTLSGNVRKYVLDCLDSTWISSHGRYIEEFENAFARFCGVKYAVATNNGTTALHLALVALGVGPGDEVIVPTVTYVATANAVRYCGARPILVDVAPGTLNIDPSAIEAKLTPNTKGIIPVHLYGHPAEMNAIRAIASRHGLFVLEDAAEAHGAEYQNQRVGSLGDLAAFSFFGNKILTTGEGGMVTTNSLELTAKLRIYRGQGMDPQRRYWFPVVGYNYRMTNIQAAIGLAQTETIEERIEERARLADWYSQGLSTLSGQIILPSQRQAVRHVYWMYTIYLSHGGAERRDAVIQRLDELGIETRPVFHPIHTLPPYREDQLYPIADEWAPRGISLPTHSFLTQDDVARISSGLSTVLRAA